MIYTDSRRIAIKKILIAVALAILTQTSFAATSVAENATDQDMVLFLYTNKIFGKTNIKIELPQGSWRSIDTGVYKVIGMDVMVGNAYTGRESYKIAPPVIIDNPLMTNGYLRFFKNINNEIWCEFKFGNTYGQGVLVKY